MAQLRPKPWSFGCLENNLTSRPYFEHTAGPCGQTNEEKWGFFYTWTDPVWGAKWDMLF